MQSFERLKDYLAQDPGNAELACNIADLQFSTGNFAQARDTLMGLPDTSQQDAGVQFRFARLDLVSGEYLLAEQRLLQLRQAGHDSSAVGHDIAFAQLCQRRVADAANSVHQATVRYGASPELQVLKARIALMARDYGQAQQAIDVALSLEPDNATALGLRALGFLDAGENPAADEAAAICLARHPDQHEALLAAGTLRLWQGDTVAAEMHFQRALERFPNSGRALSGMGQVQMLAGQLEQAQATLLHAVGAMSDHIGTWHALGWTQLLQGEIAAAEQSYRSAYDLDRNFAESHGGLAVVMLLDERFDEGEGFMKRALKLDPQCISGRYARTLWLQHRGEQAESDAVFAELLGEGALPGLDPSQARLLAERLRARVTSRRESSV